MPANRWIRAFTRIAFVVSGLFLFAAQASSAVGRTPGDSAVSPSGAAQYTIPLWTPPGIGALIPRLGLSYNHLSGNGLLGIGWSVSGLSAISRCDRTIAQDGSAGPAKLYDLTHEDRFCLDGQRLRLVAGTYGVAGSEYRTEIEAFARITAQGTLGTGPAWFKVEGRDGLIYEYGQTATSRVIPVGYTEAESWALSRVYDRSSGTNFYTLQYTLENGALRPDFIQYTGNTGAALSGAYEVKFQYEVVQRPDPIQEYAGTGTLGSGLMLETHRLQRIEVKQGGVITRQYGLAYESGTGGISRLRTVIECAQTTSDCLQPTTLDWHNGIAGFSAVSVSTGEAIGNSAFPVELNGDGFEDVLWSNGSVWKYMLGQPNGQFGPIINSGKSAVGVQWRQPIQWDGDGKADLLYAVSNTFYVLRFNGSGFDSAINTGVPYQNSGSQWSTTAHDYWAADLDGDGRDDLVRINRKVPTSSGDMRIWARLRRAAGFGAEALAHEVPAGWFIGGFRTVDDYRTSYQRKFDFNGDTREDLLIYACYDYEVEFGACSSPEAWHVFVSNVSAAAATVTLGDISVAVDLFNSAAASNLRPLIGDFNADDKSDLVYPGATNWHLALSRGATVSVLQGPPVTGTQSTARVTDWEGDGYSDLFAYNSSQNRLDVMRSNGQTLEAAISAGLPGTSPSFVVDANGDALGDFFVPLSTSHTVWLRNSAGLNTFANLLKRATDGFGVHADFSYRPLTDPSVYTKLSSAVYPDVDTAAPRYVVSQMSATDGSGAGSTYALSFTYQGGRVNLHGRGFLGFAQRTVLDNRLGYNLKSEETYRQDWPLLGLLSSAVLKQSSGTLISQTDHSWAAQPYGSGYAIRHFPYVYSSTSQRREVGGAYNGTLLVTTTAALAGSFGVNGLDTISGLITDLTTTTTENATGLATGHSKSERIYHASILNDTANWCLGRPQTSQSIRSHTLTGGASQTRTVNRVWDTLRCRVDQQIIEPGDLNWQVTTAFGYDSFGNLSSEQVTGAGMSARTTMINWGAAGQFPETVTNALLQTTTQGFRYDLGLPTSITDANSLTTSWTYDTFGRRTQETRPDGTDTAWSITTCASCEARVKSVLEQQQRTTADVVIRTDRSYLDRFNRPVHQYQQLPGGAYSDIVVQFDARGRVIRRDMPYWGATHPTGSTGSNGYTEIVYDLLDRVTAERLRTAAGVLDRQTTHAYNGLSSTSTDPKTYPTTRWVHGWGDLARVTDAANGNTNYQYDAFGQLTQVSDALGNLTTTIGYNVRGMKTSSTDMDLGSWTYLPNALGEVTKIRDAKTAAPAWTTQYQFDGLGRPTQRTEAEGTTTLTWGTSSAAKNIGQLASLSGPGYAESLTYDSQARLATRAITTDTAYQIDHGYDALTGLPATLTYPTSTSGYRFKLQYEYAYGMLSTVKRFDAPFTEYWKLNTLDARGNVHDATLGNGLKVVSGFDPLTGLMDYRQAGPGGGSSMQNLAYDWDLNGNLSQRQDLRQSPNLTEVFTYDALNRLDTSTLNGSQNLNVDYNLLGNITAKSDVGGGSTWTYHASKKHAVTVAGAYSFTYDNNGNLTGDGAGGSASWYSYNLPNTIAGPSVAGPASSQFFYAPTRERYKQVASYGAVSETTHYLGGILEKVISGTSTSFKHTIAGASGTAALYTRRSDGTQDTYYLTRDHLGSVDSVTNQAGAVQVRLSFDAFGKRRKEAGWSGTVPSADYSAINATSERGYTGHEHLDNLALIHMNGRVYHPTIGRFLSPDPFVQAPYSSQSLNRYAYVWNNPLTLIDPSGFQTDDRGGGIRFGIGYGRVATQHNHYPPPHQQRTPRSDGPVGRDTAVRSTLVSSVAAGSIAVPASEAAAAAAAQAADKAIRAVAAAGRVAAAAAGAVAGVAVGVLIPSSTASDDVVLSVEEVRKAIEAQKAVSVADQSVSGDPNQLDPDEDENAAAGAAAPLSRSAAFRQAKELAGIPRSAQPTAVRMERLRDQAGNVQSRVYEYVRADGSRVTIREHSLGHGQGNLGPHFNVEVRPPGGGPRQPLQGGADGHVFFGGT